MSNETHKDWRWALQYLRDQGWTFVSIGAAVNASEKSVRRWFKGVKADGASGTGQATKPLPAYQHGLENLAKREERKATNAPPLMAVPA